MLVQDNLNTHTLASLYEAFAPEQARRLAERFEVQNTPNPRQLVETGGDRVKRAGAAVPGPARRIGGGVAAGGGGVGGRAQRPRRGGALALHHGRSPHLAPSPLPLPPRVVEYSDHIYLFSSGAPLHSQQLDAGADRATPQEPWVSRGHDTVLHAGKEPRDPSGLGVPIAIGNSHAGATILQIGSCLRCQAHQFSQDSPGVGITVAA